ncbi:MAG: sn-glycerol-3-phosphate ABC transporter ATP-binding protein UgpC [Chloroflexia bacterium]|nr:sn-glycerol-3-phosphate ABC transporter ATP-binding protein UgpC [Chloroflexia bacterium]
MARVTFNEVWKRYGSEAAVKDLTLETHDGEFVVLVGPSGSGKSTAMRMVAGLEEISDGYIAIGDRVVNDLSPKDRDIAMVFQSYALYPHMSVYDNLAYGLKLRHFSKSDIEERVSRAAQILDIEPLLQRKPKALSGGQRQRVALGRAIVREPQAFLMDEPLSNLDAKLRVQTRAELIKLHRRLQTTTIYVTHDQVEAMTMGDRIAVLNFGELQQFDTPANLYDKPRNVFVAGFIGSPSMNFFNMDVIVDDGALNLKNEHLTIPITGRNAEALRKANVSNVTVGIRPEHILDSRSNGHSPGGIPLPATVDVVETLGNEFFVYLNIGADQPIVARLPADLDLEIGQEIEIIMSPNVLHFFDPESGETISGGL